MLEMKWLNDHYVAELSGVVTISDTQSLYSQLVSTERIEDIEYGLVDCTNIDRIEYVERDYERQAVFAKTASMIHRRDYKVAIVVSSEEIATSVKKFFQAVREKFPHQWERRMFFDLQEGIDWASTKN